MGKQFRFVVDVDRQWQGKVTCRDADIEWEQEIPLRELRDGDSGARAPALEWALHDPDDPHDALGPAATVGQIQELYDAVLARDATREKVKRLGHYLFDALLGEELWGDIVGFAEDHDADAIELALSLPVGDYDLNRFNWELLHSKGRFLGAAGPPPRVAITRVVPQPSEGRRPPPPPEPLDVPPRVLFVVGTSLTEEDIRPGAELYALLRQARDGRAMRYRLLEQASPERIRTAVAEFHPQIVHVICHGGIDADDKQRVFLDLRADQGDLGNKRYAEQLALDLVSDDWRPTIVVLSACLTAGAAGSTYHYLARAHESAPFAATLVQYGIPIVLGMAGHVADITSRLFARNFAESVIHGQPLVLATAKARNIALADTPEGAATANWALPAVYMSPSVPTDYRPVDAPRSDALWEQIETWIEGSDLVEQPVFCGRGEVIATFPRLFENPGGRRGDQGERKRVLAILVENKESGYGRSRLLKEMAAQAFRDGHLPVLLQFDGEDAPRDHRQLVAALDEAISRLRVDVLDIGDAETSQLYLLDRRDNAGLSPLVQRALGRDGELTEEALRRALQIDLASLLADARREIEFFAKAQGQVVVMLDDVDQYGELTARFFAWKNGLLRPMGLGTTAEPVPVVMTCSRVRESDTESPVLRLYEKPWSISWLAVYKLGRFQKTEDLLACQAVLLNPFAAEISPDVSGVPWAFSDAVDATTRARYERRFRRALDGMPCQFQSGRLYAVAGPARDDSFLVLADDDTLLATLPDAV
jgi:hypothetical protein